MSTARVHLLLPANEPDVNVCKLLLSSRILGYPTGHLIRWGVHFDPGAASGSHIAKMTGVHEYVSALPPSNDDDLVITVDALDSWFQLPMQVFLDRYRAINARANERILKQVGPENFKRKGVKQTIVMSTQKRCWPSDNIDAACWAVPASPLPDDLYGEDTDHDITPEGDNTFRDARVRPRFVNSGLTMGPVRDIRDLLTHLLEFRQQDLRDTISDQAFWGKAFGAQEYERQVWAEERRLEQTEQKEQQDSEWKFWKFFSSEKEGACRQNTGPKLRNSSILDPHPTRRRPEIEEGKYYQFGLGLDYLSELSFPTVFSNFDVDWVRFIERDRLHRQWEEMNITNPQSDKLPQDLVDAKPPFDSLSARSTASEEASEEKDGDAVNTDDDEQGWADVPLFTNLWTGVIPAIIHHNAHMNGLKANRETMWPDLWLQPRARELLAQRLSEPAGQPLAVETISVDDHGKTVEESIRSSTGRSGRRGGKKKGQMMREWLDAAKPRPAQDWGAQTDKDDEDWVNWNDLCDEQMQEEVFRDGKGKFDMPEEMADAGSMPAVPYTFDSKQA